MRALIAWILSLLRPRPAASPPPPAPAPAPSPRPSIVTADLLVDAVMHCSREHAELFAPHLDEACHLYGIDTRARLAAFLAQVGHESGGLVYVREIGSHAYLDKYDTGALAKRLGNSPDDDDDGQLYRGRGLIQTTGRANYRRVTERLRARFGDEAPDFETYPKTLEQPRWAALSAGDYWDSRKLNVHADAGSHEAFVQMTRLINGGANGLADRLLRWERAKRALGV